MLSRSLRRRNEPVCLVLAVPSDSWSTWCYTYLTDTIMYGFSCTFPKILKEKNKEFLNIRKFSHIRSAPYRCG